MSHPDAERTSSPSRGHSDEVRVGIFLFPCGDGDTILIQLPGDRWALVDCCLPNDGTRQQFFDFVKDKKIPRLDWIFQTHPDYDHFHGMVQVLDYFTSDGRTVGYWCDSGLTVPHIQSLVRWWSNTSRKRYKQLQAHLDDLDDRSALKFVELNDRVEPISPAGYEGGIDFFPIGPSATLKRRTARADLARLGRDPQAKVETNELSVVLALCMAEGDAQCNALLPGDAGPVALPEALAAWRSRGQEHGHSDGFDVVKIPHHGSLRTHVPEVCKAKRVEASDRVAAVSASGSEAHPDREVLRDYVTEGWTVMATMPRVRDRPSDSPAWLADRSSVPKPTTDRHLIEISWTSTKGLDWKPPQAVVDPDRVDLYETAADSTK